MGTSKLITFRAISIQVHINSCVTVGCPLKRKIRLTLDLIFLQWRHGIMTHPNQSTNADHVGKVFFDIGWCQVLLLPLLKVGNLIVRGISDTQALLDDIVLDIVRLKRLMRNQLTSQLFSRSIDALDNSWFPFKRVSVTIIGGDKVIYKRIPTTCIRDILEMFDDPTWSHQSRDH